MSLESHHFWNCMALSLLIKIKTIKLPQRHLKWWRLKYPLSRDIPVHAYMHNWFECLTVYSLSVALPCRHIHIYIHVDSEFSTRNKGNLIMKSNIFYGSAPRYRILVLFQLIYLNDSLSGKGLYEFCIMSYSITAACLPQLCKAKLEIIYSSKNLSHIQWQNETSYCWRNAINK